MKYNNFYHIPVPGDGACFYHSIVTILYIEENPTIETVNYLKKNDLENIDDLSLKLRKKSIRWLKNNLDTYIIKGLNISLKDEIQEEVNNEKQISKDNDRKPNYKTINQYFKYMSKIDSYAGQIEIYAISEILKRNIRVFIHNKGKFSNVGLGYQINNNKNDIFIYHNLGKTKSKESFHFESLIPKTLITNKLKSKNLTKEGKDWVEAASVDMAKRIQKNKRNRTVRRKMTPRKTSRRVVKNRTVRRKMTPRKTSRRVVRNKTVRRKMTPRKTSRRVVRNRTVRRKMTPRKTSRRVVRNRTVRRKK